MGAASMADRFTLVTVTFALALVTVVLPAGSAYAAPVPPVGGVAYQYGELYDSCQTEAEDGCGITVYGIGLVGFAGGDARALTDPPDGYRDVHPAFSADGLLVMYDRLPETSDGRRQLRVVRTDGSDDRLVAEDARGAAFSPDGRHVAYVHYADGTDSLVVAEVDDGQLGESRVVATSSHVIRGLEWSPLSDRVAYYRDQLSRDATPGYDQMSLYTVSLDGRPSTLASGDLNLEPVRFSWSPDGSQLAVLRAADPDAPGEWFPWLVRIDGSPPRLLIHPNDVPDRFFFGVQWAPHGQYLVVTPNHVRELWLVTPHGGLTAVLSTPDRVADDVEFTADGTALVITIEAGDGGYGDLYLAPVAAPTAGWRLTSDGDVFPHGARTVSPGLTRRLGGIDRIATAIVQSGEAFDSAASAVLATASDYADGLVAGPLASHLDAPLLLTGTDRLDPRVADILLKLGVEQVVVVGGTAALSMQVEHDLRSIGIDRVQRLAGEDRFELAGEVARQLPATSSAYLVEGAHADPSRGWPDAVAVSALASHTQRPILLTRQSSLPAPTRAAITRMDLQRVTVVGGTAAVSEVVADETRSLGAHVDRVWGADRFATSAAVADASEAAGLSPATPVAVTARDWPDALTAGTSAAAQGHLILLVDGTHAGADTASRRWLGNRSGQLHDIRLVGGVHAITPAVAVDIERVAAGTG